MPPLERVDHLNAGTPLGALAGGVVPVESFYVRSNFEVPQIDVAAWSLQVGGNVSEPASLSLADLMAAMPVTEIVTMECAGNFRTLMSPVPKGTPWGIGGFGVAEFTGVPLRPILEAARPEPSTLEWVFTGADRGETDPDGTVNYAFSLEADLAMASGPMLAWEMNGRPLTPEHGFPLRLVVPDHYGMRSVKWLTSITAVDRPFTGHFRRKYRYFEDPMAEEGAPVDSVRVRSLILHPESGRPSGESTRVDGIAWSGHGPIVSVEIRIDAGPWREADLGLPKGRFSPTPWSLSVSLDPGDHVVTARAVDAAGGSQPLEAIWNRNGYGNNVVHQVAFAVEG